MRIYESIFVTRSDLDDAQLDDGVERVKKIIEKFGGEILKIEKWGKKKLAYPVKRNKYGHYVLIYFNGQAETISELDRHYKLTEDIIKHFTVKTRKGFKVDAPSSSPAELAQAEVAIKGEKVGEGI